MADEENNELDEEEKDDEAEEESSESDSTKDKKDSKVALDKSAIYAISKIKAYLADAASKDELFKAKYDPTDDRMAECWKYICGVVKSTKRFCLQSQEMFNIAFEFFNDGLKADKNGTYSRGKVMAETRDEDRELAKLQVLTDEEKKKIHSDAVAKFEKQQEENLKKEKELEAEKEKKRLEKEEAAKKLAKDKQALKEAERIEKVGAEQLSLFAFGDK